MSPLAVAMTGNTLDANWQAVAFFAPPVALLGVATAFLSISQTIYAARAKHDRIPAHGR